VGGKFGIILRPIDLIRVGLSYHTPVRLNLQKDYEFTTTVNYDGINYTQDANRLDRYEYQIVTPGRLTASTAVVLGKFMVITADFERVDYRSGRLNDKVGNANFTPANDAMKTTYGIANNLRTGLEIATGYTRWRLGYGLLGSPYQENVVSKEDGLRQLVSGGFGWLYGETYFFDLAVQGIIGKTYLSPYAGIPSSAVNESLNLNFVFGAGYRF
jgi:long-subunit fatty acid transport protein